MASASVALCSEPNARAHRSLNMGRNHVCDLEVASWPAIGVPLFSSNLSTAVGQAGRKPGSWSSSALNSAL